MEGRTSDALRLQDIQTDVEFIQTDIEVIRKGIDDLVSQDTQVNYIAERTLTRPM